MREKIKKTRGKSGISKRWNVSGKGKQLEEMKKKNKRENKIILKRERERK